MTLMRSLMLTENPTWGHLEEQSSGCLESLIIHFMVKGLTRRIREACILWMDTRVVLAGQRIKSKNEPSVSTEAGKRNSGFKDRESREKDTNTRKVF